MLCDRPAREMEMSDENENEPRLLDERERRAFRVLIQSAALDAPSPDAKRRALRAGLEHLHERPSAAQRWFSWAILAIAAVDRARSLLASIVVRHPRSSVARTGENLDRPRGQWTRAGREQKETL